MAITLYKCNLTVPMDELIGIICCASAARSSLSPVHVANGTFVDANGRARFFRGVNVVYKDSWRSSFWRSLVPTAF